MKAVIGHIVDPLDDFRNPPPRAGHLARLTEQLDAHFLVGLGQRIGRRDGLRLDRQVADLQTVVQEGVSFRVDARRGVVAHRVADVRQTVGEPVAQAVAVQYRHHHVDVGLELDQPLPRVAHRAVADALELDAVVFLEGLGEGDEILAVHLHGVGMAGVADQLIAVAGNLALHRRRPVALDRPAEHDHRAAVTGVPVLHSLQGGENLVVVVAVIEREDVPAVGRPLTLDFVAVEFGVNDAADEGVVDAGVVERQQDAQAFAHLHGHRLGFELLGVPLGHGELALETQYLEAVRRADEVPEGRLARRGGDADTGRTAVDVVGHVGGLGVSGEGANAAQSGLREERVAVEVIVLQESCQGAGTAPEPEGVNRQDCVVRVHAVAGVAGSSVPAAERLAHDHPQGVGGGDVVPAGEHELVAERVLGAAVIVPQAAQIRPGKVQRDVVRRVGQRPAKMPRLSIIAHHHQGHAGHETDVIIALAVVRRGQ